MLPRDAGGRWRRALVTGASSGIGEAFARALAGRGTDLVLVARREQVLDQLAEELGRAHAIEVEVLPADLTSMSDLRAVEDRVTAGERAIDLLVNNAGGSPPGGRGPFATRPIEVLHEQALLNAVAVMRLTHAAVRTKTVKNVIQVSAGTAFYPVPYGAVYAASKAFVNSFSEAVDFEMRGSGVAITTVCPGFTRTEAPLRIGFSTRNIPSWWWSEPEEVVLRALPAAARGKPIVSPKIVNRLNALVGRRFPRTMMRMSARIAGTGS